MKRFLSLLIAFLLTLSFPLHAASGTKAIVYVFVGNQCPVSNFYAPEIERIYKLYAPQGVRITLVNEDRGVTSAGIATHSVQYQLTCPTLPDTGHALAKRYKPTVTPEAFVVSPSGSVLYRGRIDNKYADFGKVRPQATTHDLRDALDAVLSGKPVPHPVTKAIGCFL